MNLPTSRPRWSTQTKLTISLLLLAFGIYLLIEFSQVIAPFILAVILAYILAPLARRFQDRLKLPKALAILLAYLVFLLIAVALPVLAIPYLTTQFGNLNLNPDELMVILDEQFDAQIQFGGFEINLDTVFNQIIGSLEQLLQPVIGQTINLARQIVTSLVWVIFIFVISFYLIKDAEQLGNWVDHLIPPGYKPDYKVILNEINEIWSAFFRGQLILSVVVAIIISLAGLLVGLPFALAMGILAGILEFLPSIGHGIWLFFAVVLSLVLGSAWMPLPNWAFALLIAGLHIVFQQFDLNYLIPRIIGRSVHLPPLVVILGIVAAAVSVGVLGIPLAAPTIASARVFGRYLYGQLFDIDLFPWVGNTATPLPPPDPQWWRRRRSPGGKGE
jgi:predicted PurR-regulated permease PerM